MDQTQVRDVLFTALEVIEPIEVKAEKPVQNVGDYLPHPPSEAMEAMIEHVGADPPPLNGNG